MVSNKTQYDKLPSTYQYSGPHKIPNQFMDLEKAFICNRCNKPVRQVSISYGRTINGYKFQVFCHGETDECFLPREVVMAWFKTAGARMEAIRCFQQNKLTDYQERLSPPDSLLPQKR